MFSMCSDLCRRSAENHTHTHTHHWTACIVPGTSFGPNFNHTFYCQHPRLSPKTSRLGPTGENDAPTWIPFPLISKACLVLVHMKNSQSLRHHESFSKITTILGWQSSNKPTNMSCLVCPFSKGGRSSPATTKTFCRVFSQYSPNCGYYQVHWHLQPTAARGVRKSKQSYNTSLHGSMHPAEVRRCIRHSA